MLFVRQKIKGNINFAIQTITFGLIRYKGKGTYARHLPVFVTS